MLRFPLEGASTPSRTTHRVGARIKRVAMNLGQRSPRYYGESGHRVVHGAARLEREVAHADDAAVRVAQPIVGAVEASEVTQPVPQKGANRWT